MQAVAVKPSQPNSAHLANLPKPSVHDVPGGLGVLVRVLKVGVDATDREINDGLYGNAPDGFDFLVLGHESFGVVEAVGSNVRSVKPGDYVTATVRRPGKSIYDVIGTNDMTSDETYYERGINLLHGYLTEYFVEEEEYIVYVPDGLKHLHVLMEPMSCAAKAVSQAFEVQRRLKVWRPRRAFVLGAGQIGLLATLILRLRGLEVFTIARRPPPRLNADIVEGLRATYVSAQHTTLDELADNVGKADVIIEASGNSQVAFDAMKVLAKNGIMVWESVTGGNRQVTVPGDAINLEWVLGNKALVGCVNGNRFHFEMGIQDLALGEMTYPGVVSKILTNPVDGLENYAEMIRLLVVDDKALKVFVNVASE